MTCAKCKGQLIPDDFICRGCGTVVRRRTSEAARDRSPFGNRTSFEYAGFFTRAVSSVIDRAVLAGVSVYLMANVPRLKPQPLDGTESYSQLMEVFGAQLTASVMLSLALSVIYSVFFLSIWGRTIGGFITGTRVLDDTGTLVFPPAAMMRALAKDFPGVLFVIGVVGQWPMVIVVSIFASFIQPLDNCWALWDDRGQTLHDKVGGTIVVKAGLLGAKA